MTPDKGWMMREIDREAKSAASSGKDVLASISELALRVDSEDRRL
jgi:hypothetical protein